MVTVKALGREAMQALNAYISIHDNIFNKSILRNIRRLLPIPGIFDAIPYSDHAAHLSLLRADLCSIRQGSDELLDDVPMELAEGQFLEALVDYCVALDDTLARLEQICVQMAAKASAKPGPSWAEYNRSVDDYLRSVEEYSRLGDQLTGMMRALT